MKWVWRILAGVVALGLFAVLGLYLAGFRKGHGRNSATVEIDRPAAQVFRYMTNDDLVRRWVSGLEEIRHLTPGNNGAGARLWMAEVYEGQRVEMEFTITRFEPNRRLEFTVVSLGDSSAGFRETGGYTLEEQGGRTRLTLAATSEYHGFLPRLMEPFITPAAQKKLEADLTHLKQLVEAEPRMAPATR